MHQKIYAKTNSTEQHRWGRRSRNNGGSRIDVSHSRQPLVKGERLVRYEVNAVMLLATEWASSPRAKCERLCFQINVLKIIAVSVKALRVTRSLTEISVVCW